MVVARWGWVRVRVHSFTGGHQQGTAARGVGVRRPSRAGSRRRHAHAQGAGAYRILMKLEVDRWALDRRRASTMCPPRGLVVCCSSLSLSVACVTERVSCELGMVPDRAASTPAAVGDVVESPHSHANVLNNQACMLPQRCPPRGLVACCSSKLVGSKHSLVPSSNEFKSSLAGSKTPLNP